MSELVAIGPFDVFVIEPTLAGCAAAWQLAQGGLRVALASTGTSPGYEHAACLQPWIEEGSLARVPEPFRKLYDDSQLARGDAMHREFHLGQWTQAMEDLLLDAGVELFYHTSVAGGLVDETGRCAGALLGGKFGLNAVLAPRVIDATADGILARCLGAVFTSRRHDGQVAVRQSMLIQQRGANHDADADSASTSDQLIRTATKAGELVQHGRFVELHTHLQHDPLQPLAHASLALAVRRAALTALGDDGWQQQEMDLLLNGEQPCIAPMLRLSSAGGPGDDSPLGHCRADGCDGLYVAGPCADLADDQATALAEAARPAASLLHGLALADALLQQSAPRRPDAAAQLIATLPVAKGAALGSIPGEQGRFSDPGFQPPQARSVMVRLPEVPVVRQTTLLVAGMGTSGYTAACTAAAQKTPTLAIEKHGDLGGTHTVGGVPNYWFGRRTEFFKQFEQSWRRSVRYRHLPLTFAMLDHAKDVGCDMLLRTTHVGVAADERAIKHVFVTNAAGLVAIQLDHAIDASGDGDLAAWAGAAYTYGRELDEMTMWCSFGKFQDHRSAASRLYHDVVDQRSLHDTARGVICGRRQTGLFGAAEFPQPYLAVRESRHIVGRARLRFADILTERHLPDAVLHFRSNIDLKGMAGSDLSLCGFVEPEFRKNYTCDVPLPALQPRDIDNLLVIGKAYDCEHDALSHARMQSDLMAMGGLAAIVADHALQHGKPFTQVAAADVLERIEAAGILSENTVGADQPQKRGLGAYAPPTDRAADALSQQSPHDIASLLLDRPLTIAEQTWLAELGEPSIEPLRNVHAQATGEGKRAAARLLTWLGDPSVHDTLLAFIDEALAADALPEGQQSKHGAPDHGYAPEPVFAINCLSRARGARVLPRLEQLAARLQFDPQQSDHRFHYAYAFVYAAQWMPGPELGAACAAVAGRPGITERTVDQVGDIRLAADHVALRFAFLEMSLGRAMYRCGHPAGRAILESYSRDRRLCLARSAMLALGQQA